METETSAQASAAIPPQSLESLFAQSGSSTKLEKTISHGGVSIQVKLGGGDDFSLTELVTFPTTSAFTKRGSHAVLAESFLSGFLRSVRADVANSDGLITDPKMCRLLGLDPPENDEYLPGPKADDSYLGSTEYHADELQLADELQSLCQNDSDDG